MSATEIRSLNGYKLNDETARSNIEKLRTESQQYTDTKISQLINSAPTTLDTLGEIAAAMAENATVVEALNAAIGSKADKNYVDEAIANFPVGEPDWNANEGEEGYIKNKPFGYGHDYFEYEFNGNLEDYEYFPLGSNAYIVKVGEPIEKSILESKENNFAVDIQSGDLKRTFPQLDIGKTSSLWMFAAGDSVVALIVFNDENELNLPKGTYITYPISQGFIITSFYYNDIKTINKKYLPSISKIDWQETNSYSDSYIKNKTHYEEFDSIKLNEDFLNNEKVEINSTYFLIKASDETIDFNKLVGSYFIQSEEVSGASESYSVPITTTTLKISDNVAYVYGKFYVVAEDSSKIPSYDITLSKGVWFVCTRYYKNDSTGYNDHRRYVSELRIVRRIHQLDPKFIPTATDDEIIDLLISIDAFPALTDESGNIYTDEADNILLI